MKQKIWSIVLACVLTMGLLPIAAFAEVVDGNNPSQPSGAQEEQALNDAESPSGAAADQQINGTSEVEAPQGKTETAGEAVSPDDQTNTDSPREAMDQEDPASQVVVAQETSLEAAKGVPPVVSYRTHVQNDGWQDWKSDGAMSGTSGRALRLEGINIKVDSPSVSGGISYRTHVQNDGWQDWKSDGAMSGTSGRALRLEAIQIKLTGDLANSYDVYYRVHAQNIGWMNWAKNGQYAGTAGKALRLEAIQIVLVPQGSAAPAADYGGITSVVGEAYRAPYISYSAHVQNVGWQSKVSDGELAGTTGRSLRVEALKITKGDALADVQGSVQYCAHVQNIGWQDWAADGAVAGTSGRSYRVEAVRIQLTGDLDSLYDVYYRVHASNIGWLDWAKNGSPAGTEGAAIPLEGVQIVLVNKGGQAPGSTDVPFITSANIEYSSLIAGDSTWQATTTNGGTSGTTGQDRAIQQFKAAFSSSSDGISGGVSYKLHVASLGWQDAVSNNEVAGVLGKSAEAISISLTGDAAKYYDIYYRAHIDNYGWMDWAKNGQYAGSSGIAYKLQAVQIKIVPKTGYAPGSTENPFTTVPYHAGRAAMDAKAQGFSSSTGNLILTDVDNCLVGIYSGYKGHWTGIRYYICSPGAPSSPTLKGTYTVGIKGYSFGSGYTCYYYTQYCGDYLFHSILYDQGTFNVQDGRLGVKCSQGCIRLALSDAKWIYDNISSETTVHVY